MKPVRGWYVSLLLMLWVVVADNSWAQERPRFRRISVESGLSQASVNCILQDRKGFLWFGTDDGLNRYDGYEFKIYKNHPDDPTSLVQNTINSLHEDEQGRLWIGTFGGGLDLFDPATDGFIHHTRNLETPGGLSDSRIRDIHRGRDGNLWLATFGGGLIQFDAETAKSTIFRHQPGNSNSLASDRIARVMLDDQGENHRLWVATFEDGLDLYDPETNTFTNYRNDPNDPNSLSEDRTRALLADEDGMIWVGTYGGLNRLDPATGKFTRFLHDPDDPATLSEDRVWDILTDRKGRLWVGTDGGLSLYMPETESFVRYQRNSSDPSSISSDRVLSMFEDREGHLWVGTYGGGINMLNSLDARFGHYRHDPTNPASLSFDGVRAVFKDSRDRLWVGTYGGGLNRLDPGSRDFVHYRHDPANPESISSDRVYAALEDHAGRMWFGTSGGGLALMSEDETRFKTYRQDPENPDSDRHLSDDRVYVIYEDSRNRLWAGSYGGLDLVDRDTETFRHYRRQEDNPNSLSENYILCLTEDSQGRLWVGTTSGGVNVLDEAGERFTRYRNQYGDPGSLSNDRVFCIFQDSRDHIWVGTGGGLNLVLEDGSFHAYRQLDGLPNDVILGIVESDDGGLWMSTNRGLSLMDPKKMTFRNYDAGDGLQSNQFSLGAHFKDRTGKLFFGGAKGLNQFYPADIADDTTPPGISLTEFLMFNKPVRLKRYDEASPLEKDIGEFQTLTLDHTQYLISFEFAALHFSGPAGNTYAYKLEGLDRDWITTDAAHRRATYTKPSPGEYQFRVKGANKDGIWSKEEAQVNLRVLPPPWATWWAYAAYILAAFWVIGAYVAQQRRKLAHERSVVERLTHLDKLKDEFLANTSHELRTPLNGMIGLAESLIAGATGDLSQSTNANLAMIVNSGRRLSGLVNDILDFSKLKSQHLELSLQPVDPHSLTEVVLTMSRALVHQKPVALYNDVPLNTPAVMGDENRLEQVLYNLVGNAVKFTGEGTVTVTAEVHGAELVMSVIDTGIGIPADKHETIFKSFEQGDGAVSRQYGGTGLGLAVSRQLVSLHQGRIWVESEPGKGSAFRFSLPLPEKPLEAASADNYLINKIQGVSALEATEESPSLAGGVPNNLFRILVVDDEAVNRQVVVNHLSMADYRVVQAASGQEALDKIRVHHFDLILLDIMMPFMSGYEVCKALRAKYDVAELPIIFLSAKNQIGDLILGFGSGANDYITKPICRDELMVRVKTHLDLLDINRNLDQKVTERTRDLDEKNRELEAMNQEILRKQDQLIVQEKMASLGTVTAGIAHEIRNPLNFINNFSSLTANLSAELREDLESQRELIGTDMFEDMADTFNHLEKNLTVINKHGKRAENIIRRMMELSGGKSEWRKTDINDLVREFATLALNGKQSMEELPDIEFTEDFDADLPHIVLGVQDMSRVMINVVTNALEGVMAKFGREGASYQPKIRLQTEYSEPSISIWIRDNGIGIEPDLIEKVFLPFVTTKPTGSGHIGLGLAIAYDIVVREHSGTITINSKPGEYTETHITLLTTRKGDV